MELGLAKAKRLHPWVESCFGRGGENASKGQSALLVVLGVPSEGGRRHEHDRFKDGTVVYM